MKAIIGLLMILGGLALGAYVGLWLMFVGGIIQVIEAVQVTPVNASGIAWGIVRIVFASAAGWLSAWLLILPGLRLITSSKYKGW